jgi:ATP-dependent DNA helicase RecG
MVTPVFGFDLLKMSERLSSGIEQGESQFREFKSAFERTDGVRRGRDVKSICRDIGETLVAFANADGGELFIGVEDEGSVTGVPHKDELVEAMVNAPKTHVHHQTPLPSPTISRFQFDAKTVLYFQVPKSTVRVHLTCDGRCLQRFDTENRPVAAEEIQYSRQERASREYDREFVDGALVSDLDAELMNRVSRLIAGGQSAEKFLQYVDLADYRSDGVVLRRAALLLFAKDINKWHPRCQIRIARVAGAKLGVGKDYNISKREDNIVRDNILRILESAWDTLRPYLARTRLVGSGIFAESLVYPDDACQEALINAVAHRDYSAEGKGIEILVFDDRLEINSPGGLLSSISLSDLTGGKRAHQSRNAYISRVLREVGYMREMGEGMLRIFSAMKDRDLVPPEIKSDGGNFELTLHHRSVFSPRDQEWLNGYAPYGLSRDEQRVVLLGRDGALLSTNEIMKVVGIADVDEFRKLVERLRRKGILYKGDTNRRGGMRSRNERRWSIRPPDQVEQYMSELLHLLKNSKSRSLNAATIRGLKGKLSSSSPFKENPAESLKLLSFLDERFRPLPAFMAIWGEAAALSAPTVAKSRSGAGGLKQTSIGKIIALKTNGYGFIQGKDGIDYFFHISDLTERSDWDRIRIGNEVEFAPEATIKGVTAKQVSLVKS